VSVADWKEKLKELKRRMRSGATGVHEHARPAAAPAKPVVPRTQIRDLCVGLDFGTSATKAVVRLLPAGPAYAVPLGEETVTPETYLGRTRLWIAADGSLSLNPDGDGRWAEALKVRLMDEPWQKQNIAISGLQIEARAVDLAAAYLALTLRRIFDWCRSKVLPDLGDVAIRWSFNLGIPVRDWDAQTIKSAFLTAARAGWHLAREKERVDLRCAAAVVDRASGDSFTPRDIDRESLEVVPEVAAGVACYARSPRRRAGPHLFVDIGATTLDASMFLLVEDEGDLEYVFLSAEIDSALGALRLHGHRAKELERLALMRVPPSDPLAPVPQTARGCLPSEQQLLQIDAEFAERCVLRLGSVVYHAKKKSPHDLSVRDDGPSEPISVLISGGGASLELYREVIRKAEQNAGPGGRQGLRIRPFRNVPIPEPPDLRPTGLPAELWRRLAIAYGLSYRKDDIGKFVPESAVPDMPLAKPREDVGAKYVSKDQV
jgi:hypothetical protein